MGICWFSVMLMEGIIKVFCRSPAQAAARGSHCRRGSEAEGYLWIPHWFPCDWCRFWELLWYLYTISREYTGSAAAWRTRGTSKVWTGSQGLRRRDQWWVWHSLVLCSLKEDVELSHTSCSSFAQAVSVLVQGQLSLRLPCPTERRICLYTALLHGAVYPL